MSLPPGTDLTTAVIGEHPFRVQVYFGDRRTRAFVVGPAGGRPAPGLQVTTRAANEAVAATGQVDLPRLAGTLQKLGLDFPFLLNLACEFDPQMFRKKLAGVLATAGRAPMDAGERVVVEAIKRAIDEARALGPGAIINGAMLHLEAPDGPSAPPYGTLVSYVNHVLVNAGGNPRFGSARRPIGGVGDIAPEGVELWWIKEGSATIVFQALVHLAGDRPPVRFILNVAKDPTQAADELRRAHADFLAFYRIDPRYVMEPLGSGTVTVSTWRGASPVAVLAAEWFDGHELHVYETGPRLHVWQDQAMSRSHPIPEQESDRVWEAMIRIGARYTRRTPRGLLPVATHVNAGDFIFRQGDGGLWDVLLIWSRQPPDAPYPDEYLVVTALLAGVRAFGLDRATTVSVWWDRPERALRALAEGLAMAGLQPAEISALFRRALDGPFTEYATRPEGIPCLPPVDPAEQAGFRQVFGRARQALADCVRTAPGVTN